MTATPSSARLFSLAGRVALVTGSSTGLGKGIARCLGLAGAKVAVNYANAQPRAEESLAELCAAGITAELFRADVTSEAEVDGMFSTIERSLGPVDIVIVNATPPQPLKTTEEYDWAFHQQMLDFFVKSPYPLARRALPGMKARRHGRLINITSEMFHLGVAPLLATIPMGGWVRPEEVGWAAAYLASDEAAFVTGQTIAVNGGKTCW